MLFSILKKIPLQGRLEIVDSRNNLHSLGKGNPYVKIKLKSSAIQRKIFLNPSLHVGEAYMNGDLIILEGSIENFISIISSSYDDFLNKNWLFKIIDKTSAAIRSLQQLNKISISKKNVAHHYDLNEELYRYF